MMLVEVINAKKPAILQRFCVCYRCPQRV